MADHIIRSPEDRARLWRVLEGLNPNRPWRISITQYRSKRSNDQNKRAFALYRAIADETGHSVEEVHTIMKHKFGEPRTYKMGDIEVTEYTTRDRDIAWFGDYLDRCEAWSASELGVTLG